MGGKKVGSSEVVVEGKTSVKSAIYCIYVVQLDLRHFSLNTVRVCFSLQCCYI